MIPGTNLFNQAMTVFTPQEVIWYRFRERTVSGSGKYINQYYPPVIIMGSLQSVNRKFYQMMGLDLNKNYKNLFTNDPAFDVDRGRAGDRFEYGGRSYDAVGSEDWFEQDSWKNLVLVDVGESRPLPVIDISPINGDDVIPFIGSDAVTISGTASNANGYSISLYIDGILLGITEVIDGIWSIVSDLSSYADGNQHTITAETFGPPSSSRSVLIEAPGPAWDPDFQAWIDGISQRGGQLPAENEYQILNDAFVELKTKGIWDKTDSFQPRFMPTLDCALADWRAPSRVAQIIENMNVTANFVPYQGIEVVNPDYQEYQEGIIHGFVQVNPNYKIGQSPGNYNVESSCLMTKDVGFGTGLWAGSNWCHRKEGAWVYVSEQSVSLCDSYFYVDNPATSIVSFGVDSGYSSRPFNEVYGTLDQSILDDYIFRQRTGDNVSVETVDSVLFSMVNSQTAIPSNSNWQGNLAANTPYFKYEMFYAGAALTDQEKSDLIQLLTNLQAALQGPPV